MTVGDRIIQAEKALYAENRYLDYHLLHGLGAELAFMIETLSSHRHIHRELFPVAADWRTTCWLPLFIRLPGSPRSCCSRRAMRILNTSGIGISLTELNQMVPELSVSGFIIFNRHARYFNALKGEL